VTELEVEEALQEAWAVLQAGPGAPASARRLAAALLALTTGSPAQPHWVTPDDLWRDRLAVLAEQGAWLAAWGPRPGEPGCRVPPALLPEAQARREGTYALWRAATRAGSEAATGDETPRKPGSRSRRPDGAGRTGPKRPRAGRARSSVQDVD
jgi:hypothetical protein